MIAKRIISDKNTSSIARLVRYVVNAKGGLDPRSWERTADYILDSSVAKNERGEKVGGVRVTNCETDDPILATRFILMTQEMNVRSKAEKTYHLVFSFPSGEQPPLDVLHAIEDELCASIGYAEHQRISAVHIDTDNLHVHVAINQIHPSGFQNIQPYQDMPRLMEACERLEIKYGLERDNHGLTQRTKNNDRRVEPQNDELRLGPAQRPEERDSRFRRYLSQSCDLAISERPEAKTLNGLRNLSGCHMARAAEGTAVLLSGDARTGVEQSGEEPADGVRRAGNGARTDAGFASRLSARIRDIEVHSGVETLAGYCVREVSGDLRQAGSWQVVHAVLAGHGLVMKPRGSGLVVGDPGLELWTKAGSIGREFSLKAMTDRLGPFAAPEQAGLASAAMTRVATGDACLQPDAAKPDLLDGSYQRGSGEQDGSVPKRKAGIGTNERAERGKGYVAQPLQEKETAATQALFARYQQERQEAQRRRLEGVAVLRREGRAFEAELTRWAKTRHMLLTAAGSKGGTRRAINALIRQQAVQSREKYRQQIRQRRETLTRQTSVPCWSVWLTQQAERGDVDALEVLRGRAGRAQRWHGDLLTAKNMEQARTVILNALKPQARKDGAMLYHTLDGGVVIDRGRHVQAKTATTGAALVALELAAQKFDGQPLIVEGSAGFRSEVARLAGLHNIKVTFADPVQEQWRQEAATIRNRGGMVAGEANDRTQRRAPVARTMPSTQETAPVPRGGSGDQASSSSGSMVSLADPMIANWIASRNRTRESVTSLEPHRLWQPSDAGTALYQGRRHMEDGSEILLLKRNGEMLVKPATARVVARASTWKLGRTVHISRHGRFVDKSGEVEV